MARGTKAVWNGHQRTLVLSDGETIVCDWQGSRVRSWGCGQLLLLVREGELLCILVRTNPRLEVLPGGTFVPAPAMNCDPS